MTAGIFKILRPRIVYAYRRRVRDVVWPLHQNIVYPRYCPSFLLGTSVRAAIRSSVRSATMAERRRSRARSYRQPMLPDDAPCADLQEERSATQRQGPAGGGATLIPVVQDSDVEQRSDLLGRSATMAERRRRVEDMTTAAELPIKYQKTFNKKHTQEEAGDLVQQALMRDRDRVQTLHSPALFRHLACSRRRRYIRQLLRDLRFAMSRFLSRDTMRCDTMRCDAMRCDAMRCDAMRCNAMTPAEPRRWPHAESMDDAHEHG